MVVDNSANHGESTNLYKEYVNNLKFSKKKREVKDRYKTLRSHFRLFGNENKLENMARI